MTTNIATLAAKLAEARADLARWERLTSAADRVKALSASFDKARAAQAKADEAAAKEAAETRFKGLANLRVTSTPGRHHDESAGPLGRLYRITWTQPEYDYRTMASPPQPQERTSFNELPENVLAFLIEKQPDQIPAEIIALAPGDPAAAMQEYFLACRRGYLRGKAA